MPSPTRALPPIPPLENKSFQRALPPTPPTFGVESRAFPTPPAEEQHIQVDIITKKLPPPPPLEERQPPELYGLSSLPTENKEQARPTENKEITASPTIMAREQAAGMDKIPARVPVERILVVGEQVEPSSQGSIDVAQPAATLGEQGAKWDEPTSSLDADERHNQLAGHIGEQRHIHVELAADTQLLSPPLSQPVPSTLITVAVTEPISTQTQNPTLDTNHIAVNPADGDAADPRRRSIGEIYIDKELPSPPPTPQCSRASTKSSFRKATSYPTVGELLWSHGRIYSDVRLAFEDQGRMAQRAGVPIVLHLHSLVLFQSEFFKRQLAAGSKQIIVRLPPRVSEEDMVNFYVTIRLMYTKEWTRELGDDLAKGVGVLACCSEIEFAEGMEEVWVWLMHKCKSSANKEMIRMLVEEYPELASQFGSEGVSVSVDVTVTEKKEELAATLEDNDKIQVEEDSEGQSNKVQVEEDSEGQSNTIQTQVEEDSEGQSITTSVAVDAVDAADAVAVSVATANPVVRRRSTTQVTRRNSSTRRKLRVQQTYKKPSQYRQRPTPEVITPHQMAMQSPPLEAQSQGRPLPNPQTPMYLNPAQPYNYHQYARVHGSPVLGPQPGSFNENTDSLHSRHPSKESLRSNSPQPSPLQRSPSLQPYGLIPQHQVLPPPFLAQHPPHPHAHHLPTQPIPTPTALYARITHVQSPAAYKKRILWYYLSTFENHAREAQQHCLQRHYQLCFPHDHNHYAATFDSILTLAQQGVLSSTEIYDLTTRLLDVMRMDQHHEARSHLHLALVQRLEEAGVPIPDPTPMPTIPENVDPILSEILIAYLQGREQQRLCDYLAGGSSQVNIRHLMEIRAEAAAAGAEKIGMARNQAGSAAGSEEEEEMDTAKPILNFAGPPILGSEEGPEAMSLTMAGWLMGDRVRKGIDWCRGSKAEA
ncbi:hypothetical protein BC937DRAFT_92174 [Endogone sp. FLAS-F59071]|nr:hypothetical protein BC937DRAFT_92174 [Endogone sp. FLAS-F59071]|eukprot:RUS15658.1 hypothetical protein BC937DRAFT_92174 [Endogone sp. FLAS-F59071]